MSNESAAASRLTLTLFAVLGLTPEAIHFRRFATHETAQHLKAQAKEDFACASGFNGSIIYQELPWPSFAAVYGLRK